MEELPEDVRASIQSADLEAKIQKIGAKHQLHVDQIGNLLDETILVMLAFSDASEFTPNIQSRLGVTGEKAEAIAEDISNEVFMSIRQSLQDFVVSKSAHSIAEILKSEDPAAPATPTPSTSAPIEKKPAEVSSADLLLANKTVNPPPQPTSALPTANQPDAVPQKTDPAKPNTYKTDPYREPVE